MLKGSNTILIAALFQKNPFCVMSLADKPLSDPKSMIGKKIGVQAVNTSVFNSFLKANDLEPSQLDIVPVQFDPTPLANGQLDGWFSFITNEPNLLKVKGIDTKTFLLNDYNYPLVSQVYVVPKAELESKRDALKAFLKADIMGWHDALKDPAAGAELAVNEYGKSLGLTVDEQTLESKAQNELILDDRTKSDGIMTMTDQMIEENIKTLALGGTTIKADQLFDLSSDQRGLRGEPRPEDGVIGQSGALRASPWAHRSQPAAHGRLPRHAGHRRRRLHRLSLWSARGTRLRFCPVRLV